MSEAAKLAPAPTIAPPRLLVEWSSPWEEFVTAIRPALAKSPKRLAGEAETGIFPYRGILAGWLLEALLLAAATVLPAKLAIVRSPIFEPLPRPNEDVIYFSGEELPRTEDLGGARTGKSGRAGGRESYHRSQTIRVARGESAVEKVVDVPKLNIPRSDLPVANLLAINRTPGPPPTSGLRSPLAALPQPSVVPPTPEVLRDKIRTLPNSSASIVAPPPEVQRQANRSTLTVATSIVAPPPELTRSASRSLPNVNSSIVAPAPDVNGHSARSVPNVSTGVIAPAPDVKRDQVATTSAGFNPAVVPPSPFTPRFPAGVRVAQMGTEVVPPPVSAPVSAVSNHARLTMPQAGIVAPPPSRVSREGVSSGGTELASVQPQVVPPPVHVSGNTGSGAHATTALTAAANVVAPPPAQVDRNIGSGGRSVSGLAAAANVVAPPPTLGSDNSVSTGRGVAVASNVVPPPPTVKTEASGAGTGKSRSASALTGADPSVTLAAPAVSSGTGNKSGVVVSSQPGARVAVPGSGSNGSMAMSPVGTAKAGLGGSGGGEGIGRGNGPGSGLAGEGSGASKTGSGRGSEVMAKAGTSPFPGPGGAGKSAGGSSPAPGISVVGGNTINLPSFGGGGGGGPNIVDPTRVHSGNGAPGITVEGTSRSGGAFNFYGAMKGDKVYTIYIDTALGTAVLQYSDPSSAGHAYAQELSAPQPMRADLPAGLSRTRTVIACIVDKSGTLKDLRVLEPRSSQSTGKLLASLASWKFRPAQRGSEPVAVNAILGFNIDTR